MAMLINDASLEKQLRDERAVRGIDRYDEVWDGVYVMAASPNHEHQRLVARLTRVLDEIVTDRELGHVLPGINVSDRVENWKDNYRIPDVAVLLNNSNAVNHGTFWFGGPDFGVEISSPNDQPRTKLDFYAEIGTRELLIIDRDPWQMQLFRLEDSQLVSAASVSVADAKSIESDVVAMQLSLQTEGDATRIRATDRIDGKSWLL